MPGALEGLRIVDLTTGLAGPLATMMLGDHGADVVKVEPPERRPAAVVRRVGRHQPRASAASCSTSTRRPIATGSSSSSTPPTCWSRASRPGTSPTAASTTRPSRGRPPVARVLLADRLPAHDRRRRPPRHRPPGAGPLGHAVRAARLPRGADLPARAAAEHRGVVPRARGRSSPRCTCARSPAAGNGWRPRCTRACWRSPPSCGRTPSTGWSRGSRSASSRVPSIYECADGLWVHSMHFAGGRGKDRSIVWEILGIDPPDLEWSPTGAQAFDDVIRDAIGRMKRQDLLDQFWANEIADRAGAARARGARGRAGVNNGMSVEVDDPVLGRVRQAGISFRLHARADAAGAGPATRDRAAHRRGARRARRRTGTCARAARPAKRPLTHALEGIKVLDLGNFLAGPFGPMLLGDLGATVYKLESPQGDQMRPVTQPFNGCQRGQARRRRRPQEARGARDRAPADPRGRRRAPQHAAGRRRAAGRRLRDRQAAQPLGDLLPHDDVGQRRPARDLARLRPARAVVVRARARAGRRGQRPELVPLRHVRPGVRGAVGARGADGAVLARAHRRGPAGRHVDRERWRAPQHRRVDRPRRLVGAAAHRPAADRLGPLYRLYRDERRLDRARVPRADALAPRAALRGLDARASATAHASNATCSASARRSSHAAPRRRVRPARRRRRAGRDRAARTPGARGSTTRTSSPPASSPTTSTRPTGASASSATSSTSRTRPAHRRAAAAARPALARGARRARLLGRGDADPPRPRRHPLARLTPRVTVPVGSGRG